MAFYLHILPNYLDSNVFEGHQRLMAWWEAIKRDEICARILNEIKLGFVQWEDADVFSRLYGKKSPVTFI